MVHQIYFGALVQAQQAGIPLQVQMTQGLPLVVDWQLKQPIVGIFAYSTGFTTFFIEPGPKVRPPYVPTITISAPVVPPPAQFSTADGTIQGKVDGVNRIFTVVAYLHRAQVFKNGILQTLNYDCAFGGLGLVFMKRSTPVPGDIITISGWSNW